SLSIEEIMSATQTYGANIAFIEELYEKYRMNPEMVSASWREFFHDYQPQLAEEEEEEKPIAVAAASAAAMAAPSPAQTGRRAAGGPAGEAAGAPISRPTPVPAPPPSTDQTVVVLRGAAGKIAQNMEASLAVPTATSVRSIP